MSYTPKVRMEKARSLRNISALGFTILELIVALVIFGLLATIVVPALQRRAPDQDRKQLANYLNRVHKIVLNLSKRIITLEAQSLKEKKDFKPVKSSYLRTEFNWAPPLIFKNIYIDKEDKMRVVHKLAETWFFIVPDGLAQPVVLNIIDVKDTRRSSKGKQFSLVLNPFTMQFREYDSFQSP